MAALDTNVLVRWLAGDDVAQCDAVARLLHTSLAQGERFYVPVTVLLETEWVLRSRYRFSRNQVARVMDALLGTLELELQDEPAIERALWLFKHNESADFADCLHVGLAHLAAKAPLITLDKRASRLIGTRLLESE